MQSAMDLRNSETFELRNRPSVPIQQRANSKKLPGVYFRSRRIRKADVKKPWLSQPEHPREKWVMWIPVVGMTIGLFLAAFLVWDGWHSVIDHDYELIYDDDFSNGLDRSIWEPEIQVGGYGNGQFEQTTDSSDNLFVDEDGILNLKATLQEEIKMETNNIVDLQKDHTCTSDKPRDCIAATDMTPGNTSVIPPVLSARIHTKNSVSITYGRVCVTAKMPLGDWLWPAIWMMPVNDTYGPWPASGEIDIVESRGNDYTFAQGGNNIASSTLHWGPSSATDAWWRTYKKLPAGHTTYSAGFFVYCLEWSQKYLFTYINSRLMQVLYVPFDEPMWSSGKFSTLKDENGTGYKNKWGDTTNAPFDQPFYLILSLAVGGTNGWFEDGRGGKPWFDGSPSAKRDFWKAREEWYPTWKQPSLQIKKVQVWQQTDQPK